MVTCMTDEPIGRSPVGGALGRLIEVEERIEVELAEAEAEARRIVEQARRNAQTLEQDGSSSLDEALDALRRSVEKECAVAEREIVDGAEADVERYRGIDPAMQRRLAQWLASQVAGGSKAS